MEKPDADRTLRHDVHKMCMKTSHVFYITFCADTLKVGDVFRLCCFVYADIFFSADTYSKFLFVALQAAGPLLIHHILCVVV